ncbi:MAG: RNA 2',3'-cyclic phosphodiesterase [Candidatus Sulfotelmatobacter sp.]
MRLFVAVDLDNDVRSRAIRFVEGTRGFAPEARWARPESLHVTLKFIGEQSEARVDEIKPALGSIEVDRFEMNFRGYGFFPTARTARVFWIGIEAGSKLTSLAATIDAKLGELRIPPEEHSYNAHLTLARGGGRSASPHRDESDGPNRGFQRLQEKLAALPAPEFGTMTAREFFLYQSQLSAGGSRYTKLATFSLR